MGDKLVITSRSGESDSYAAVGLLSRLGALSKGVIQNNLNNLPWTLPKTSQKQNEELKRELERLGFSVEWEGESDDFWPSEGISLPEDTQGNKDSFPKERQEPRSSLPQATLTSSQATGGKRQKKKKVLWLGSLLFLLAIVGISRIKKEKKIIHSSQKSASSSSRLKSKRVKSDKSVLLKVVSFSKGEPAKVKKRRSLPTVPISELELKREREKQRLKKVMAQVKSNPDNASAWSEWIESLEKKKKWKKAAKLRAQYYRRSSRVKAQVTHFLKQEGRLLEAPQVSVKKLKASLKLDVKGPESIFNRGYFLYKELHKLHGNKELSIKLTSGDRKEYYFTIPTKIQKLSAKDFSRYLKEKASEE